MTLQELLVKIKGNPKGKELLVDAYVDRFLQEGLLKNGTLQEAFGISPEEMELLYAQGYAHYQAQEYETACEVFRWLVILNTFEKSYWIAFGASQQLLGFYEKALHSYAIVTLLDDQDPLPHFHAYECYRALKNEDEAAKAHTLFNQLGGKDDSYSCKTAS